MKKKIIAILIYTLLIATAISPVIGTINVNSAEFNSNEEVTFAGIDDPNHTMFENYVESSDVILVRSLISNITTFYEVPPGEYIVFFADGSISGSSEFESFEADADESETTVTYTVTEVSQCSKGPTKDGPWTPLVVGSTLTTCEWYKRDVMTCSSLKVKDQNGNNLSMPHTDIIYIIVAHHVPNDPRFENVYGYKDYADFNYASFDTTSDYCVASGNTLVKTGAQIGLQSDKAEAFIPQRYGEPKICCKGSLDWKDISPGKLVAGTFEVCNCGEPGSLLNWQVDSWPAWGSSWTFTPSSGTDLPHPNCVTVDVSVVVPDEKNANFSGEVKVINTDDPSDFCTIPVSLTTPKNKPFNFNFNILSWLFDRFPNVFPILRYMMGL